MVGVARERRVRLVLAVGCLTAVATSAAEPFQRADGVTLDLEPASSASGGSAQALPGDAMSSAQLTVHANESAHLAAESFDVEFALGSRFDVVATLRIVPDDARLPTHEVRLMQESIVCVTCKPVPAIAGPIERDGGDPTDVDSGAEADADDDAGGVAGRAPPPRTYERIVYAISHELCPARGDCEIAFTLQRIDEPFEADQGPLSVQIVARVERSADPQFFCPDNRDFRSGATVEIEIDD